MALKSSNFITESLRKGSKMLRSGCIRLRKSCNSFLEFCNKELRAEYQNEKLLDLLCNTTLSMAARKSSTKEESKGYTQVVENSESTKLQPENPYSEAIQTDPQIEINEQPTEVFESKLSRTQGNWYCEDLNSWMNAKKRCRVSSSKRPKRKNTALKTNHKSLKRIPSDLFKVQNEHLRNRNTKSRESIGLEMPNHRKSEENVKRHFKHDLYLPSSSGCLTVLKATRREALSNSRRINLPIENSGQQILVKNQTATFCGGPSEAKERFEFTNSRIKHHKTCSRLSKLHKHCLKLPVKSIGMEIKNSTTKRNKSQKNKTIFSTSSQKMGTAPYGAERMKIETRSNSQLGAHAQRLSDPFKNLYNEKNLYKNSIINQDLKKLLKDCNFMVKKTRKRLQSCDQDGDKMERKKRNHRISFSKYMQLNQSS